MSTDFDAIVVGSGPGGYITALKLARGGKSVAMVERERIGGTCLNWGCIPSKALIHVANLFDEATNGEAFGLTVESASIDPVKMQEWKGKIVNKLCDGIGLLMDKAGVTVLEGDAKLLGGMKVAVTTGEGVDALTCGSIILATGASPMRLPGLEPDGDTVIESREALELDRIPDSMAIIGGGVIGLEIGGIYSRLGTKVTIIEMMDQILPGTDRDLVRVLARTLKKRGVKIHTGSKAASLERTASGAILTLETPKGEAKVEAEKVLVAVGFRPRSSHLGLQDAGVLVDDRGFIGVNEMMQTSIPDIYAIGDVTGVPFLAHKASWQGLVAAASILEKPTVPGRALIPAVAYTSPDIGSVGMDESAALAAGMEIAVGRFPFAASGRALAMESGDGMVKVVASKDTGRVLGVGAVGPDVDGIIAEATLAIEGGLSVEQLSDVVHAHPTLSESLVEAAEDAFGLALHLAPKRQ